MTEFNDLILFCAEYIKHRGLRIGKNEFKLLVPEFCWSAKPGQAEYLSIETWAIASLTRPGFGDVDRWKKPAMIVRCSHGHLLARAWFFNGRRHRSSGPATIYYTENSEISYWFYKGIFLPGFENFKWAAGLSEYLDRHPGLADTILEYAEENFPESPLTRNMRAAKALQGSS